jgi:protein-S-isoprenylcysteine O-methyltransferase Ste14
MTGHAALIVIGLLWLAWLVYWLVSARGAKMTLWREPRLSEIRHRWPIWVAVLLFVAPRWLPPILDRRFLPPSEILPAVGILIVAAGLGFSIWARVHLGRNWSGSVTVKENHTLVTSGPYARIRHPIYTGILLAFLGTALAVGEWRALLALILVFVALIIKSRTEEERMCATFPHYDDYRRRTAALVPFVF